MKLISRIRLNIVARRMKRFNKRSIKTFFRLLGTKDNFKFIRNPAFDENDIKRIQDIINKEPSLPKELQIALKPREEIEKKLDQQGIKIIIKEKKI